MFKRNKKSLGESKNWYTDKYEYVRQQRDLLMAITLMLLVVSLGAVMTVVWITPYKSVEPFVIQIDEKSGIVRRVDPVTRTEFTANEAIDRFFVAQYIRARESYIPSVFSFNYEIVRVMSSGEVFSEYREAIDQSNPTSLGNLIGLDGTRKITFKSISFVNRNEAYMRASKVVLVRLLMEDFIRIGQIRREYHSIVNMEFRYGNLNLNETERYLNPIGFLVTDYQINREVVE